MSARAEMQLMLEEEELLSKVAKRKAAGEIDSDEEEHKKNKIQKMTKAALKQLKKDARKQGEGRQAPKQDKQDELQLKAKSYQVVVGKYPNPKVARKELFKQFPKWLTPPSGLHGSNPCRSFHATEDMFFLVTAKGKEEVATIFLAEDAEDQDFEMPEENQGGLPQLNTRAPHAVRCVSDALQCVLNALTCDGPTKLCNGMRSYALAMHCNALYDANARRCVTMHAVRNAFACAVMRCACTLMRLVL